MNPVGSGSGHLSFTLPTGPEQQEPTHPNANYPVYNEEPTAKMKEIADIREALFLSQEKVLWEVLDEGRLISHSIVRKNPFLLKLTLGGFCQTEFMKYLVNLFPIHSALEEAQQILLGIDHLKVFVFPELYRSQAIKRDLEIWEKVASQEFVPWKPSDSSIKFAEYIRQTAKEDPEKIIAIMYTLYGTIMSGGQTNRQVVQKQLKNFRSFMDGIPPLGSGVALYEIVRDKYFILDGEEVATFKMRWHQELCRVQKLRPTGKSIEDIEKFHGKLKAEVVNTFEKILEFIKNNVETGHC